MPNSPLVLMVPVELIAAHPRKHRPDPRPLTDLVDSIRGRGLRQHLLLVPRTWHHTASGANVADSFTVVVGQRLLAAAHAAGLASVPAVVDPNLDEADQLRLMLMESLQCPDLTPAAEGAAYQGLLDLGFSIGHIARLAGRPERAVKARLRRQWAEMRDTLVARGVRPFLGRLTAHALVASVERPDAIPDALPRGTVWIRTGRCRVDLRCPTAPPARAHC